MKLTREIFGFLGLMDRGKTTNENYGRSYEADKGDVRIDGYSISKDMNKQ